MKVYSFQNTVVIVNGVEITGWAEGDDPINIARLNDSATHETGADGHMMVSLSADKSGEFTFKLQQTSSGNKYLMSLCALQEGGAKTFVPCNVLFQDTYRNDLATSTVGYIKKPTNMQRGQKGSSQEWTIVVERLDMLLGDPALVGVATAVAGAFGG
jgi:hypothetical protein